MALLRQTKECVSRFKKDFRAGKFSQDDGRVLKMWAREMEIFGPDYIQESLQWRDHTLRHPWQGYRASCFSASGRIIYRIIDEDTVEICEIARITPDHDYERK